MFIIRKYVLFVVSKKERIGIIIVKLNMIKLKKNGMVLVL